MRFSLLTILALSGPIVTAGPLRPRSLRVPRAPNESSAFSYDGSNTTSPNRPTGQRPAATGNVLAQPSTVEKQVGSVPAIARGPNQPDPAMVLSSISASSQEQAQAETQESQVAAETSYSRSFGMDGQSAAGTATNLADGQSTASATPSVNPAATSSVPAFTSTTAGTTTESVESATTAPFQNSSVPALIPVSSSDVNPSGILGQSTTTVQVSMPTPSTPSTDPAPASSSGASSPQSSPSSNPPDQSNNIATALMFNSVFATLNTSSTCDPQSQAEAVACVDGLLANCQADGTFVTAQCPQDQRCFALPLPELAGVSVQCENIDKAEQMLGLTAQPSTSAPAPAAVSSAEPPSSSAAAPEPAPEPESPQVSSEEGTTTTISSTTTTTIVVPASSPLTSSIEPTSTATATSESQPQPENPHPAIGSSSVPTSPPSTPSSAAAASSSADIPPEEIPPSSSPPSPEASLASSISVPISSEPAAASTTTIASPADGITVIPMGTGGNPALPTITETVTVTTTTTVQ